jgi:hypothetical protein
VKYAVVAPVAAGVTADPGWTAAFARHLETCGFESIIDLLAFLAAHTDRLGLTSGGAPSGGAGQAGGHGRRALARTRAAGGGYRLAGRGDRFLRNGFRDAWAQRLGLAP